MNKKSICLFFGISILIFLIFLGLYLQSKYKIEEKNSNTFTQYNENTLLELQKQSYNELRLINTNKSLLNIVKNIKVTHLKISISCKTEAHFFKNISKTTAKNLYIIDDCGNSYDYTLQDWENLAQWKGETLVIDSLSQKINSTEAKILSKMNVSKYIELGINDSSLTKEIISILKSSKTVKEWSPTVFFYD